MPPTPVPPDLRNPVMEIDTGVHSHHYETPRVAAFGPHDADLPPDWRLAPAYWRPHWKEWFRARERGWTREQAEILDAVRRTLDADLSRLLAVMALYGPTRTAVKVRAALIRVAALPEYTEAALLARSDHGPDEAGVACPFRLANDIADIQADLDGLDLTAETAAWVKRTRDIAVGTLKPWEVTLG